MFFVATFSEWMASGLWPTALPLVLQLVLALIIGDLGAYWFHRACHGTTLLHRLHELHHAAERNHPQSLTGNHVSNEICGCDGPVDSTPHLRV